MVDSVLALAKSANGEEMLAFKERFL